VRFAAYLPLSAIQYVKPRAINVCLLTALGETLVHLVLRHAAISYVSFIFGCFRHIMEQYQFLVYSFFKEMYSKLCKNEGTTKDKAIKSFISFQVQCHSVFFFLNATMY